MALCAGNSPVPVTSPHKGRRRGALMFSVICVWINGWVNNREACDLRHHRGHYGANVMRQHRFAGHVQYFVAIILLKSSREQSESPIEFEFWCRWFVRKIESMRRFIWQNRCRSELDVTLKQIDNWNVEACNFMCKNSVIVDGSSGF